MAVLVLALIISFSLAIIGYCLSEYRRFQVHLGQLQFNRTVPEVSIREIIKVLLISDPRDAFKVVCQKNMTIELPYVRFLLPTLPILVINDPRDIQQLLSHKNALERPFFYKYLGIEYTLLSCPSEMWKPHRKILNYSYGYSGIRDHVPIFKKHVDRTLEELNKRPETNLFEHLALCNVGIIISHITESHFDAYSQEVTNLIDAVNDTVEVIANNTFRPWMFATYHLPWSKFAKSIRRRREAMEQVVMPIIEKKQKELAEINEDDLKRLPKSVLNQMVTNQLNGNLTYEEVRDEMSFNLLAGIDAMTTLTKCVLIHLAMYPDVQEKLVAELKTVFVSPDITVDFECVKRLNYLERIIKESSRLLSLAPFIARLTTGDVLLKNFTVPRGTLVAVPFYRVYRDKKIWGEDADKFNPDRITNEEHPSLYFSAGPKSCIARLYTDLTLKLILSQLLINYHLDTDLKIEDLIFQYALTVRIINENPVRLKKRTGFYSEE